MLSYGTALRSKRHSNKSNVIIVGDLVTAVYIMKEKEYFWNSQGGLDKGLDNINNMNQVITVCVKFLC